MIICPVCEHQQVQGDECDNCGKKLSAASAATEAPVARLAELELTALVRPGLPVQAERLPELELTRVQAGPDLPPQAVPELDPGRFQSPAAVPVEAVPDLDRGRAADDGVRTTLPQDQVVCRYCRNVQAVSAGAMCERCGMKLSVVRTAATAAVPLAQGWTLCRDCGNPAQVGRMCPGCGARVVATT